MLFNSHAEMNPQKAVSLPSSPHQYRSHASERSGPSGYMTNAEMVSTWNKVLKSPMFQNKPLLAYEEWTIDFSEITVGTRVGIGEHYITVLICSIYLEILHAFSTSKLVHGK